MKYLLDTNICIYLIKKNPSHIFRKLSEFPISDIGISVITLSELEYGVEKSLFPERNRLALSEFLAPLDIAPFEGVAAFHYGKIRTQLEKSGNIIGSMDLLIAAHAIALNTTLVTNNEKEFKRVVGLKVENWVKNNPLKKY